MVYLTMLSRANITESAYGILPLGRYLNVVRGFVLCSGHLESYAAGCISSSQVQPSQTGQMLKDTWPLMLPGGEGVLRMKLIASAYTDNM
jgi:hypothetical protein